MQNEARIYSKSLEGDKQLTSSFKVKEFACNDGSDVILIHPDLDHRHLAGHQLHHLRLGEVHAGDHHAVHIAVAAVLKVAHALAADIVVDGVSPASVAIAAEKALKETGHSGGIGLYKSFVHVDVRSMKYRWDQRSGKEVAVSGF